MKALFKKIKPWLVPPFLQKLDGYLLDHYPDVWRTRGHYVLFYSLSAILLLFLAGFVWPQKMTDWVVDPIDPIRLNTEWPYFAPSFLLVFLAGLFWIRNQYQLKNEASDWKETLRILLVYALCFFMMLGGVTVALRMGTIVRAAWGLMDQEDIDYLEENDFFVYGFVPIEGDTSLEFSTRDYKLRESSFKKIWHNENRLLQNRYNVFYINTLFDSLLSTLDTSNTEYLRFSSKKLMPSDIADLASISYHSLKTYQKSLITEVSYWSNEADQEYLSYLADRIHLSNLAYLACFSERWNQLYEIASGEKIDDLYSIIWKDIAYSSFRGNTWVVPEASVVMYSSDRSGKTYLPGNFKKKVQGDLTGLSSYNKYYCANICIKLDEKILNKYGLIRTDANDLSSAIPQAPLQLENGVRSVRHARQFLREWIIWRFWRNNVLYLLPLLALIVLMIRYFSFKSMSVALVLYVAGNLIFNAFFDGKEEWDLSALFDKTHWYLLLAAPILVGVSLLQRKRFWFTDMAYVLILFILAAIAIFEMIPGKPLTGETTTLYMAYTVGLVMALLMQAVEALPRKV